MERLAEWDPRSGTLHSTVNALTQLHGPFRIDDEAVDASSCTSVGVLDDDPRLSLASTLCQVGQQDAPPGTLYLGRFSCDGKLVGVFSAVTPQPCAPGAADAAITARSRAQREQAQVVGQLCSVLLVRVLQEGGDGLQLLRIALGIEHEPNLVPDLVGNVPIMRNISRVVVCIYPEGHQDQVREMVERAIQPLGTDVPRVEYISSNFSPENLRREVNASLLHLFELRPLQQQPLQGWELSLRTQLCLAYTTSGGVISRVGAHLSQRRNVRTLLHLPPDGRLSFDADTLQAIRSVVGIIVPIVLVGIARSGKSLLSTMLAQFFQSHDTPGNPVNLRAVFRSAGTNAAVTEDVDVAIVPITAPGDRNGGAVLIVDTPGLYNTADCGLSEDRRILLLALASQMAGSLVVVCSGDQGLNDANFLEAVQNIVLARLQLLSRATHRHLPQVFSRLPRAVFVRNKASYQQLPGNPANDLHQLLAPRDRDGHEIPRAIVREAFRGNDVATYLSVFRSEAKASTYLALGPSATLRDDGSTFSDCIRGFLLHVLPATGAAPLQLVQDTGLTGPPLNGPAYADHLVSVLALLQPQQPLPPHPDPPLETNPRILAELILSTALNAARSPFLGKRVPSGLALPNDINIDDAWLQGDDGRHWLLTEESEERNFQRPWAPFPQDLVPASILEDASHNVPSNVALASPLQITSRLHRRILETRAAFLQELHTYAGVIVALPARRAAYELALDHFYRLAVKRCLDFNARRMCALVTNGANQAVPDPSGNPNIPARRMFLHSAWEGDAYKLLRDERCRLRPVNAQCAWSAHRHSEEKGLPPFELLPSGPASVSALDILNSQAVHDIRETVVTAFNAAVRRADSCKHGVMCRLRHDACLPEDRQCRPNCGSHPDVHHEPPDDDYTPCTTDLAHSWEKHEAIIEHLSSFDPWHPTATRYVCDASCCDFVTVLRAQRLRITWSDLVPGEVFPAGWCALVMTGARIHLRVVTKLLFFCCEGEGRIRVFSLDGGLLYDVGNACNRPNDVTFDTVDRPVILAFTYKCEVGGSIPWNLASCSSPGPVNELHVPIIDALQQGNQHMEVSANADIIPMGGPYFNPRIL